MTQKNPKPDRVESAILLALESFCADPRPSKWDYKTWTLEVTAAVGRTVANATTKWLSKASGEEWLWDGIAQKRRGGTLIGVPLALEVEWGGWAAIKYDFEKLLVGRVAHRVFVCSAGTSRGAEKIIVRLFQAIKHSKSKRNGDRYLLVCWWGNVGTAGHFLSKLYIV